MGSPVEFIQYNQDTKQFAVNPSAAAILRKCQGPLAVVGICGRARQGKSFLLNQLIRKFKGSNQGFTSTQYSTQIFSLAVLLCSLFVYNQMGGIDEASLEKLSLVSELVKRIKQMSTTDTDTTYQDISPAFLWLCRDFHLQVQNEGREMTPRDYLEEALAAQPHTSQDVQGRNLVRASIKALFPDRDCFALVRPATDEALLAKMDSLPVDRLRPEFRKGLDDLVQLISVKGRPKRFRGGVTTGPVLAGLAEAFVAAINQGAVPVIASAWQSVVMAECQRALDAAVAAYVGNFGDGGDLGADEVPLRARHARATEVALKGFHAAALGAMEDRQPFEQRFRELAEERFAQLCRQKFSEADAAVSSMLMQATTKLHQTLAAADGALDDAKLSGLFSEIKVFLAAYSAGASGPSKAPRLATWLQDVLLETLRQLLSKSVAGVAAAQARTAAVAAELEASRKEAGQLKGQIEAGVAREGKLREEIQSVTLRHTSDVSKLQLELSTSRAERDQRSTDLAGAQQRLAAAGADLAAVRQDLAAAQQRHQEASAAGARLQQQLDEARHREVDSSRAASTTRDEVSRLQRELEEARRIGARSSEDAGREREQGTRLVQQLAEAHAREVELQKAAVVASEALAQARGREAEAQRQVEAGRAERQRLETSGQDSLGAAQRKEASMMQQLQDAQQRLAEAEGRHAEALQRISQLSQEVQASTAVRTQLESQIREVSQKLDAAQVQLQSSSSASDHMLADARAQLQQREEELRAAKRQLATLQETAESSSSAARMSRENEEHALQKLASVRQELRTAKQQLEAATAPSAPPMAMPSAPPMPSPLPMSPVFPPMNEVTPPPPSASQRKGRKRGPEDTMDDEPDQAQPSRKQQKTADQGATPVATPGVGNVEKKSINDIKLWLTDNGHEGEVFALSQKIPRKEQWVALMKSKLGQ